MTDVTPELLARLREAAEGATPGPWEVADGGVGVGVGVLANGGRGPRVVKAIPLGYETQRANAAHIAAASPDVVAALVAEVERLRGVVGRVRALADEWQSHSIPGTTDWDYGQDVREALYSHRWYLRPDLGAEQGAGEQGDGEGEAWFVSDPFELDEPPVHNHAPWRPMCNESVVDGRLRGACMDEPADEEFEAWIGRAMIGEEQGWGA